MKATDNLIATILCLIFLVAGTSPGQAALSGLEFLNWENESNTMKVPVMKVNWDLSLFFGEPCERAVFYYEAMDDFSRVHTVKVRAQVTSGGQAQDAYVTYGPLVDSPGSWGWDVTGCGSWDRFFRTGNNAWVPEETARGYFKAGIGLTNLEIVDVGWERNLEEDADYSGFLQHVGQFYPVESYYTGAGVGELTAKSPASAVLPKSFDGTPTNSFWQDRPMKPEKARSFGATTSIRIGGDCGGLADLQQWTYGGFEHVAIRRWYGDRNLEDPREVVVTLSYFGSRHGFTRTARLATHRIKGQVGRKEGFVIVDRVSNPSAKKLIIEVVATCQEPEDPLSPKESEDPLHAALRQHQDDTFASVDTSNKELRDKVFAGRDAAMERRREQAVLEKARIAEEAERQKLQKKLDSERIRQLAEMARDPGWRIEADAKTRARGIDAKVRPSDYRWAYVVLSVSRNWNEPSAPSAPVKGLTLTAKTRSCAEKFYRANFEYFQETRKNRNDRDSFILNCENERQAKRQANEAEKKHKAEEARQRAEKARRERQQRRQKWENAAPHEAVNKVIFVQYNLRHAPLRPEQLDKRLIDLAWKKLSGRNLLRSVWGLEGIDHREASRVFLTEAEASAYVSSRQNAGAKITNYGPTKFEPTKFELSPGHTVYLNEKDRR